MFSVQVEIANIFLFHLAHRLTTYPLIHLNVFHAALNVIALAPLLERFEYEYGTLNTVALFFGRKQSSSIFTLEGHLLT
jgi:membrane associated rhomboid family serine protease